MFQNLIVMIRGSGLEVKGKRLTERPSSIGVVPFETFPSLSRPLG